MVLIRQANIYSQRKQLSEASRSTFQLAQLVGQTGELSPRQRESLRQEVLGGLDRDVLAEFQRHLDAFSSSTDLRGSSSRE
jgi:hypothetical protein